MNLESKLLEDSMNIINKECSAFQKAIENDNLRETLKHSSTMLSELRTTLLSPKSYYHLYMQIFDNLKYLELQFKECHQKNKKRMKDLYESVQHAGHVIPRVYLLITVGSIWIETHERHPREVMFDMLEMTKCIQNPVKGLFVRQYLNQALKDQLPVPGSQQSMKFFHEKDSDVELTEDEIRTLNLEDLETSVDFILTNLQEMNRLWIRVQQQSGSKEDRKDLEQLVGDNFNRLANIDSIDVEYQRTKLLPKLTQIIHVCKDTMVQQQMTLCIIKVFPDEFHIATFRDLVAVIKALNSECDLKAILEMVIMRFTFFATNGNSIKNVDVNIFSELQTLLAHVVDTWKAEEASPPLNNMLAMVLNILNFVITCYSDKVDQVSDCLLLAERLLAKAPQVDIESTKIVVKILTIPLEKQHQQILVIKSQPEIMKTLNFEMSKDVACKIIKSLIDNQYTLRDMNSVENIVRFIEPLLKPANPVIDESNQNMKHEDILLSKLVHLVHPESISEQYTMLSFFKRKYASCGEQRFSILFISLSQHIIKILNSFLVFESEADDLATDLMVKILELVSNEIENIKTLVPESMIRTLLDLIVCVSRLRKVGNFIAKSKDVVQQLTSDMLAIYEEDVVETEHKLRCLQSIIACLTMCNTVQEDDDYDTFLGQCINYSSKLLKRKHQAHMLSNALYLFKRYDFKHKKFPENVKKLTKIVNSCKINENADVYIQVLVNLTRISAQLKEKVECVEELKERLETDLKSHIGSNQQKRIMIAKYEVLSN